MKKTFHITALLILLFNTLFAAENIFASPLQEQTSLSLSELGLSSAIVMRGPFDFASFRFNLPTNWVLHEGTQLNLIASSYFASNDTNLASLEEPGRYLGALLDVYFNGNLQQSIALKTGENISYLIPITVADLVSTNKDGSFEISFFLNASIDCESEFHHTTIMISPDSQVVSNYEEVAINQDLRRLPWPFYRAKEKTPGSTFVVVPTSPSSDELQAALITMATFGRMTNRGLPLDLITEADLSEDIRLQSNLILVGRLKSLSMLSELDLPVGIIDSKFNGIQQSDGIIQLVSSTWNNRKTLLLISGNDDQGVIKAAQALSTGNLVTGDTPSYSIVSLVNPVLVSSIMTVDANLVTSADVTLRELGYETETSNALGTNYFTFEFIIPPGQKPAEPPHLNLEFSHSTLLDFDRSEGIVLVNDVVVGGIKLSAESTNSVNLDIKLPPNTFRSGVNTLEIAINLIPRDQCSVATPDGLWVTIFGDSLLHIPLTQSNPTEFTARDLYSYPFPFANDPSLGTTAFLVPEHDKVAWGVAASLAYNLGGIAAGPMFLLETAFDGQSLDEIKSRNLILIGQPKELKIVSELGQVMPAYFEEGSNIAVLESQQVIYYISPNKSLGYLEIFPSPWAENAVILGIFGTTQSGINNAGMSLLKPNILDILRGDFATLDGDKPLIVDTRTGLGKGRIPPELGTAVTVEEKPTSQPTTPSLPQDNRSQIFIGLIGTIVLMVIVIAVAFWLRKRNL